MMVFAASYGMLSTTCGWLSLSAAYESVKWTIEALKSLNYSWKHNHNRDALGPGGV